MALGGSDCFMSTCETPLENSRNILWGCFCWGVVCKGLEVQSDPAGTRGNSNTIHISVGDAPGSPPKQCRVPMAISDCSFLSPPIAACQHIPQTPPSSITLSCAQSSDLHFTSRLPFSCPRASTDCLPDGCFNSKYSPFLLCTGITQGDLKMQAPSSCPLVL